MTWGIFYILATLLALTCAVQFIVKVGIRKTSVSFSSGLISLAVLYASSAIVIMIPFDAPRMNGLLFSMADKLIPVAGSFSIFFFLIISRNYGRIEGKDKRQISVLTRLAGLVIFVIIFFIAADQVFDSFYATNEYVIFQKGFIAKTAIAVLGLMLVISLLNFANTWRASSGALKKQLLILMLFDILLLVGVVRIFFLGKVSSQFFGYLAPIALGCLIWLYSLMLGKDFYSSNIVIDRQAFLSSAVILFLGIFLVFAGIVSYVIQQMGGRTDIFLSIIGAFLVIGLFLLVLLSDSIRNRFSNAMLSRVYAGRFDYKAEWRELSEDFASCDHVDELIRLLTDRVERLFKPVRLAIYLGESNNLICRYPDKIKLPQVRTNDPIAEWIFLKSEPSTFAEIEESAFSKLKELENDFPVLIPVIAEKKLIGLALLGPKTNSSSYNNEDFAMLSAIAQQAAVTILHLRSRAKLLETEKLASFHKTASFVVHDLKNAVSMLSLMLQNAPHKMSDPEFQKESIKTIDGAVNRMQGIIEKLKSPRQKEQLQVYSLDPMKVLEKAIKKSSVVNKNNIKLIIASNDMPRVKTDPEVLETIFINILINAVEAMPDGGEIIVEHQTIDGKVEISVKDTGVGMPRSFIDNKLFRPFETTKAKGLGIGLFQCREMFRETGGEINVSSEPGKGSTFTLIFP